jgi:hypothetical protein
LSEGFAVLEADGFLKIAAVLEALVAAWVWLVVFY